MKAVVFHGIGDIRLDDVPDPTIQDPTDAIIRVTSSAICGTDLHMVRGTMGGMQPGTVLGHEGVGVVEEVGRSVRNLKEGDRVVIGSTIACGYCVYCRDGFYAQCDNANPNGMQAGTAYYGGPAATGGFHGLQAERARIPFANVNAVKLADDVTDNQAIMLSDIFPTGYFGADLADIKPGHIVAIFGCGPVGQFAIASCKLMDAGRIFAVDHVESRLETAREQGAETINFEKENPLDVIRELTGGIGPDRVIDCVGVDAEHAHGGPAAPTREKIEEYKSEVEEITSGEQLSDAWKPGDAPGQVLEWAVKCVAKAGTIAIVGVYPQTVHHFPIGAAMMRNLTIRGGNCDHRKYIPILLELVQSGAIDPTQVLTKVEPLTSAIEAYKSFNERRAGWMKVELVHAGEPRTLRAT